MNFDINSRALSNIINDEMPSIKIGNKKPLNELKLDLIYMHHKIDNITIYLGLETKIMRYINYKTMAAHTIVSWPNP